MRRDYEGTPSGAHENPFVKGVPLQREEGAVGQTRKCPAAAPFIIYLVA